DASTTRSPRNGPRPGPTSCRSPGIASPRIAVRPSQAAPDHPTPPPTPPPSPHRRADRAPERMWPLSPIADVWLCSVSNTSASSWRVTARAVGAPDDHPVGGAPASGSAGAPEGKTVRHRGDIHMTHRSTHTRRATLVAVLVLLLASLGFVPGADAQSSNPYQRGPNPTQSSIEASRGSYSTSTASVSSLVSGFGGGTIYYPTGTSETFGAVAVSPGYTASQSSMSWLGHRLASQGFVIFTI